MTTTLTNIVLPACHHCRTNAVTVRGEDNCKCSAECDNCGSVEFLEDLIRVKTRAPWHDRLCHDCIAAGCA